MRLLRLLSRLWGRRKNEKKSIKREYNRLFSRNHNGEPDYEFWKCSLGDRDEDDDRFFSNSRRLQIGTAVGLLRRK